MPNTYKHPRPAITVDNVIFGYDIEVNQLQLLLVKRKQAPFKGKWAMPGGFVEPGESLDTAAARELFEECGVAGIYLEQLYTFGEPKRDPREHVISVAHLALVNMKDHKLKAGSDASRASWFAIEKLPALAFDHQKIYQLAIGRLSRKIRYHPLALKLLPTKFSLSQIQTLYEVTLSRPFDKRTFRKRILSLGILKEIKIKKKNETIRQEQLYQFDEKAYLKLVKNGEEIKIC